MLFCLPSMSTHCIRTLTLSLDWQLSKRLSGELRGQTGLTRNSYSYLRIILTRSDFEFNQKFYLQISGCAMGRKYSPAYVDIYMAKWERTAFQKCSKLPLVYLRYLDDIFSLWVDTKASFHDFFSTLNTHHPRIKLKFNLHRNSVEFLDACFLYVVAKPH